MASELWEIARAEELRVGDFCKIFYGGLMLEARKIEGVQKYDDGNVSVYDFDGASVMFDGERTVLRRYTGIDPDVLMMAIKLMMAYIDEENLQNVPIEEWIKQAEAEIAKERESNE